MLTEAALAMMVLPVHIRSNHPAEGHESCSRSDRREEAAGQKDAADVIQRQARLGAEQTGVRIKREDAIRQARSGYGQVAWGGQGRVAVRAAKTARQRQIARELLEILRAEFNAWNGGDATPPGENGRFHAIEECRIGEGRTKKGFRGGRWRRSRGIG